MIFLLLYPNIGRDFLNEVVEGYESQPYYWKFIWRRIVSKAAGISAVSSYLDESLKKHFKIKNSYIIPNVINDKIFSYSLCESPSMKSLYIYLL